MTKISRLSESSRWPVRIAFLPVLTLNAVCTDQAPPSSAPVQLQETAAWTAADLNVSGGLIRGDTVLYWSLSGESGLLRPDGRREVIFSESGWEFVGAHWGEHGIELLARNPLTVLSIQAAGESGSVTPLTLPRSDSLEVLAAEYTTAWHLHVWDLAGGATSIVKVTDSGSRTVAGPFDEIMSFGPSHGSGLLVYPRSRPSWIVQVSDNGARRSRMPVEYTEPQPWHHAVGRTATLRSVPLDNREQLLAVADLGGDKRWLVRLSGAMSVANVTELDGSFSLLATDTIAKTLLMARDIGEIELAAYRWTRAER